MFNESDWLSRAQSERQKGLEGGDNEAIALIEQAEIIVGRLTSCDDNFHVDGIDCDRIVNYMLCEYVNREKYLNPTDPYDNALIELAIRILEERNFIDGQTASLATEYIENHYASAISVNNLFLKLNNSISITVDDIQYTLRIDNIESPAVDVTLEIIRIPEYEYDTPKIIEQKIAVIGVGTEISTGSGEPLFRIINVEDEFVQVKLLVSFES